MSRAPAARDAMEPPTEADAGGELTLLAEPANDESPTGAAVFAQVELTTWIDAIAVMLAAGLRAGGVEHAPAAKHVGPEVMDADQLAAFLGVDRKTVYEYATRGVIPHRRLGKRLLFSRTAIVYWLGSCRAASKEG